MQRQFPTPARTLLAFVLVTVILFAIHVPVSPAGSSRLPVIQNQPPDIRTPGFQLQLRGSAVITATNTPLPYEVTARTSTPRKSIQIVVYSNGTRYSWNKSLKPGITYTHAFTLSFPTLVVRPGDPRVMRAVLVEALKHGKPIFWEREFIDYPPVATTPGQ